MTVRVKQKHLILIPQHHWSPTAPHPPPLHPLLWPPAPSPLHPFAFRHPRFFGNSKKIGKKWAIICIASTWFWDSEQKLLVHTEANRGFVLDSEQKLRYSDNEFGLRVLKKKIWKWSNIWNTYEKDLSELPWYPALEAAILKCEKRKKLAFRTTHKHFSRLFWVGAWVVLQKKAWHDRDVTFWKHISQN